MCPQRIVLSGRKASLSRTERLCEWVAEHAGLPKLIKNKRSEEYLLARWLSRRRALVRSGKSISEEESQILASHSMTGLFSASSHEERSSSMATAYELWVLSFGAEPTYDGGDFEKCLYRWAHRKKSKETKKYSKDAAGAVFPNILDKTASELSSNIKAFSYCLWAKERNQPPTKSSSSKEERSLAQWAQRKKRGKKYSSDAVIFKEMGIEPPF